MLMYVLALRRGRASVNGSGEDAAFVTATLPSGAPVKVAMPLAAGGDGVASVGLRDLSIDGALDTVRELGSLIVDKLKAAGPTRTTVELSVGFAVEAGRLTSLIVSGRGDAALTVTLEWSGSQEGARDGGDP
jgi:hypothetical protein